MVRHSYENLKSVRFVVDVGKGLIIMVIGFILFFGKSLDFPFPFLLYFVKSKVDFFSCFSLFSGIVVLLSFSLVFWDPSTRGGRGGGGGERGSGFSIFESSLVGDSDGEQWW